MPARRARAPADTRQEATWRLVARASHGRLARDAADLPPPHPRPRRRARGAARAVAQRSRAAEPARRGRRAPAAALDARRADRAERQRRLAPRRHARGRRTGRASYLPRGRPGGQRVADRGPGLLLVRDAQATHFAGVQRDFFTYVSAEELGTLAAVFTASRLDALAACQPEGQIMDWASTRSRK